jgi:hypothetical protein
MSRNESIGPLDVNLTYFDVKNVFVRDLRCTGNTHHCRKVRKDVLRYTLLCA